MLRVFLTGATGYIGSAVLDALVRRGHEVTAMVRDPERFVDGAAETVKPALGSLREPSGWIRKLSGHDVFIHAAFDSSAHGPAADRAAIDTIVGEARRVARRGRRVAVIYTSGVWVLGNTAEPAGEDAPLQPASLVAFRPAHEQAVLAAQDDGIRTVVIRPGIVFGGARGIVGEIFRGASDGLVRVTGSGDNHWPLVYHRDLADLYVRLAEHADVSGVFHAVDESDQTVNEIVQSIAEQMPSMPDVRHVPIEEAHAKQGAYAEAITLDQIVRCPRSRAIGWTPLHRSVSANVPRLYEEWRR
ncbi:MAG: NAD-dependent epimerase/dehydratase family protein [Acidobacteriota bacterium]